MKKLFFLFLISFTVFLLPNNSHAQDKNELVRKAIVEFTETIMNSDDYVAIMKKGKDITDEDIESLNKSLSPEFQELSKQIEELGLSSSEFEAIANENKDLITIIQSTNQRALIPNAQACLVSVAVGAGSWLLGQIGQWIHCP